MTQQIHIPQNSTIGLFFLVCLFLAGLFAGIGIQSILLFLYVNIAAIFLPGYILLRWSDFQFKNSTSTLFASYGVGYVLMAVIYALLVYFNQHQWSPYVLYAVSAISLLLLMNPHIRTGLVSVCREKNEDNRFLLALMVVLVLFGFLVFQFPHRSVLSTGYLDMHFDNTYWLKNCIAATKGYPFPELSIMGVTLSWHMFSCFDIAMFHFACSMEVYDLCFSLSYIWHVFIMVGGAYALFKEYLDQRQYVFTAMVLTLLCSSAEPYTSVYYLDHLWGCSMGTSDAIAVSMFGLLLFSKCIGSQSIHWRYAPLTVLMVVAATGYKSANGAVLLVGVACGLLYLCLVNRKALLPSALLFLLIIVCFAWLCDTFIIADKALTSSTSNHKMVLNFSTILRPDINYQIAVFLKGLGIRSLVTVPLLVIPYMLLVHPVIPLFGVILIALWMRRKEVLHLGFATLSVGIPLLAMGVVGVIAFLALNHPGFAQCYFLFAGIPFLTLVSFMVIEGFYTGRYARYRRWLYLLIGCSFVATIVCAKEVYTLEGKYAPDASQLSHEGSSLTVKELEGLRWGRDHLPSEAVVLTNKVLAPVRGERSFITSAYMERQVYLEGYSSANLPDHHLVPDRLSQISRYFRGDASVCQELRQAGVTHVIIFKSLSDPVSGEGTVLFENDEVIIKTI